MTSDRLRRLSCRIVGRVDLGTLWRWRDEFGLRLQRVKDLLSRWLAVESTLVGHPWAFETIETFVARASQLVQPGQTVLDAGAGDAPYRPYFEHARYLTADRADTVYHRFASIDYACMLDEIPVEACSFDAVLCTEVLEHVPEPADVVREFFRVLRPGGFLFVTVPQCWMLHEEPHDYHRFTRYGLARLLQRGGFVVDEMHARGGYFYHLAEMLRLAPDYIPVPDGPHALRGSYKSLRTLLKLLYLRTIPAWIAALDRLDTVQRHTMGWACVARKPDVDGMGP